MSKHTPGPWVAKQEFANRWRIESHANGPEFIPISVGIACTTVLEVGCGNEDTGANAHLIAAAPDLLDALSNLLQVYSEPDRRLCCDGRDCGCMGSTVYQEAEHYARKAIAKAEGRS